VNCYLLITTSESVGFSIVIDLVIDSLIALISSILSMKSGSVDWMFILKKRYSPDYSFLKVI